MRYVLWIVLPIVFLFFVTLAMKNLDPVSVRYFLGHEWRAPLIFVLFVCFTAGAALGVLAALRIIVRQRRELTVLKRELISRSSPPEQTPAADFTPR